MSFLNLRKYQVVAVGAGGTLIADAAVPTGYHVRIFSLHAFRDSGVGVLHFEHQGEAVDISPTWDTDEPVTLPFNPAGWFHSGDGKGIKSVISATDWSVSASYGVVKNVV